MLQAKIKGLGEVGVNFDLPPTSSDLPPNALTAGKNVRAYHGRLLNFGGRVLNTTAPIEPYGLFYVNTPSRQPWWIEAGLAAVYVYDGTNHTDISRLAVPYALNEYTDRWTGGIQKTLGALCPGEATGPQQWAPIDTAVRLVDMTYDPAAAPGAQTWTELGYSAYAMRSYKDVLVAMNLKRGITTFPSTLQWSEAIAPGATTVDWVARATNIAGEQPLGETSGNIIDGGQLRDDFIIYKEDSAYRMFETGADPAFGFERLPEYVRIINRGCIGIAGEMHVLASRDDVVVFDGNNFRSLLDHRMRDYYVTSMFPDRLLTTFVATLPKEHEVWICFPSQGDVGELKFPDRAIVWNYHDDSLSLTDLPQCRDMDQGVIVPEIDDTFDSITPQDLTFDQDTARFDESPFSTALDFMVGAHGTSLSVFGENPTDDGTPRECIAERTGIALKDEKSGMISIDAIHRVRTIRLYMQATQPIGVQLGAQLSPNSSVFWESEQTFDPTSQSYLKFRTSGRYFGYRIRSNSDVNWAITDIELEYHRKRRR